MQLGKTLCHRAAWLGCGALALAALACSTEKPAQQASDITPSASSEPGASAKVGTEQLSDDGTTIQISEEILKECRFPSQPKDLPRFDVDQSTLRARGQDVLADVANCLKEGPLQNRTITIVGRTDARGSENHNQRLGASRADATRNYLMGKGVAEKKLLVISRGEQGATGNDAAGMALDRRVDLVLGDATERTNISQNPPANQQKATPSNSAATYADQAEGGPKSGSVTGSSGPGTASGK
jgi:peptidoglycan-associated lipoprotein